MVMANSNAMQRKHYLSTDDNTKATLIHYLEYCIYTIVIPVILKMHSGHVSF